tara:strand:+ start:34031 stop:34144 length:114 start_codon:yes stop_codon:yes gene_type:complete
MQKTTAEKNGLMVQLQPLGFSLVLKQKKSQQAIALLA